MEDKVKEVMKKVFGDDVTTDIQKGNSQLWDSITNIVLIVELEQKFNVSFEPEEIEKMNSYYSIVEVIKNKVNHGDEV